MVVVAQLAELSVVVRAVVGSNPIDHPLKNAPGSLGGVFCFCDLNRI